MKYLYVDVETTGINPREHGIIQIAALITEEEGEILDQIVLDIAPAEGVAVDPEALAVVGKTLEEIQSYPRASEQLKKLTDFLQKYISPYDKKDKFLFLAYNAPFDMEFLRYFFLSQGNKFFGSYFWHPPIDIMVLAMQSLKEKRSEMLNFKLSTVAQTLGVDVSDTQLHDAYYDILLTYEVYKRLMNLNTPPQKERLLSPPKEEFKDSLF